MRLDSPFIVYLMKRR